MIFQAFHLFYSQQCRIIFKIMQIQKNKEQKDRAVRHIEQLTEVIALDPYSEDNLPSYYARSEQFEILKDYDSAISDISKLLFLDPTYARYLKRAQLYSQSQMFYNALLDIEQAERLREFQKLKQYSQLQREKEAQRQVLGKKEEILKNKSITLNNQHEDVTELKKIAKEHEKSKVYMAPDFNQQFNRVMQNMIQQRIRGQMNLIQQQQKNYENLLLLVEQQQKRIKQLQQGAENLPLDYQAIFYHEIDESIMSEVNKQKCTVYFSTVISQMEKYYLSAKVLQEFDQKISFEDYIEKSRVAKQQKEKNNVGFMRKMVEKVFKLFDQHQSKIERVTQIMKEFPYIGSVFKIIKSAMKVCGFLEEIKVQSQCDRIISIRPSITSFNRLSAKVAYEMYRNFKISITSQSKFIKGKDIYKKNCFEKLVDLYHKFKRNQMGGKIFKYVKQEEKDSAEQMGSVHVSIMMAAVANGILQLPKEGKTQTEQWQGKIFKTISEIESSLLATEAQEQEEEITPVQKQSQKRNGRGCGIY